MVDTQHFCLRWNNYQSSITSAFENLRDDEDFVDVTLACDGKSLKAHRVVLSACSPYFRELLKSTPCKHPVIVLQDVAWTDLHALVEFIYHGEVNVHQRSLSSFLKTAEVLRVSGLTQQHGTEHPPQPPSADRDAPTQMHQPTPPRLGSLGGLGSLPNHQTSLSGHSDDPASSPNNNNIPPPNSLTSNRRFSLIRRHERRSSLDDNDHQKRSKHEQHNLNNNTVTEPEQLTPTDFSPSAMKNALLHKHGGERHTPTGDEQGSNGIHSAPSSPHALSIQRPISNDENGSNVKHEPMETSSNVDLDNSNDSSGGGGPTHRGPPSSCSAGDHDDPHDSPIHPAFLTPSESKLFTTAAGTFNFSMAALTGDPSALAGLTSQGLQSTADSLAGTSQGSSGNGSSGNLIGGGGNSTYRMPPPTSGGINEPQECPYCRRTFSCYYSLKRHFQDKHERSDTLYVCEFCHRRYRTKNSLTTHKSLQHRGTSGMLRRLLKTTAVKNAVLGGASAQPPLG